MTAEPCRAKAAPLPRASSLFRPPVHLLGPPPTLGLEVVEAPGTAPGSGRAPSMPLRACPAIQVSRSGWPTGEAFRAPALPVSHDHVGRRYVVTSLRSPHFPEPQAPPRVVVWLTLFRRPERTSCRSQLFFSRVLRGLGNLGTRHTLCDSRRSCFAPVNFSIGKRSNLRRRHNSYFAGRSSQKKTVMARQWKASSDDCVTIVSTI